MELFLHENDSEFDFLNTMFSMLEHDFISIDRIKL